jgi:hypothetical protein
MEDVDAAESTMEGVRLGMGASQREKAGQQVRSAQVRKVARGEVVGGRCYGYRSVPVMVGDTRSHVTREIRPEQADVVRRIFTLAVEGKGLCKVAAALNQDGTPSPRGNHWEKAVIRLILYREDYRGVVVWGKTQRKHRKGTGVKLKRAEHEWQRRAARTTHRLGGSLERRPRAPRRHAERLPARRRRAWTGPPRTGFALPLDRIRQVRAVWRAALGQGAIKRRIL